MVGLNYQALSQWKICMGAGWLGEEQLSQMPWRCKMKRKTIKTEVKKPTTQLEEKGNSSSRRLMFQEPIRMHPNFVEMLE